MLRGFIPVYPKSLWVDIKTFCNVLPFHIVFDEEVSDTLSYKIVYFVILCAVKYILDDCFS